MNRLTFSIILAVLAIFSLLAAGSAAAAEERPLYEDVPLPLQPKEPRSEGVLDQLEASALFAQGRLLARRQQYPEALQKYQRAWRYDPEMEAILVEIIPLALALDRQAEAARYALLGATSNLTDPRLLPVLTQLGVYLTQQEQWKAAVQLYEKVLRVQQGDLGQELVVPLRLEIGRLHFLAGNDQEAAKSFEQFLDALENPEQSGVSQDLQQRLKKQDDVTYRLIGESFLRAGKLDRAEELVRKAYAQQPPVLQFHLARLASKRGQTEEAWAKLKEYLESGSDEAGMEPYELLEEVLAKQTSDPEQLKTRLREIIEPLYEQHPENVPLSYYWGEKLLDWEQWEAAERLYRPMLEENATVEVYQGLARAYQRLQKTDDLLKLLSEVVSKTRSLDVLGEKLQEIAQDPELMRRLEEKGKSWEGEPAWAAPWAIGLLQLPWQDEEPEAESSGEAIESDSSAASVSAHGNFEAASDWFEKAISAAQRQRGELLISYGLAALASDQPDKAAEIFQRALEQQGQNVRSDVIYFYQSGALLMAGKTEEAIRAARRAIALKPDEPRYYSRLGWLLYQAGKKEEAEKLYQQLLQRFASDYSSPETREILRDSRLALSSVYVDQGQLGTAEEQLQLVLDEYPGHIGALNDLGYLWADQGKHLQRSLHMIQQAVEAEPDNEAYRDSLGWVYYRLGRYEEAVAELEEATDGESPDGVILDHLGDAYQAHGRTDKALQAWQRAASAFKQLEDEQQLKKVRNKIQMLRQ